MLSVRAITADEWATYRDLRLRALQEAPDAFGSTWAQEAAWPDELWSARSSASALGKAGAGLFALDAGQVCGMVWVLLSADAPKVANLYQMWVDPAFRRRGAGLALLQASVAWAKDKGVRCVGLTVTAGDSPAMALYQTQGFYPIGAPDLLREDSDLMAQPMALDLAE